jgi:hypothetical protein
MLQDVWVWVEKNPQLVSAAIAFAAFLIAFSQFWFAREHNRRSVRPILNLTQTRTGLSEVSNGIKTFEVVVANAGLGPAIFDKAEISFGRGSFKLIDKSDLHNFANRLFPYDRKQTTVRHILPDEVIGKDKERVLFKVTLISARNDSDVIQECDATMFASNINDSIHSLQFRFTYRSMYGERFVQDNQHRSFAQKRLRWFSW